MAEATPADVRIEIETELDDSTLDAVIARVGRDIDRDDGVPTLSTQDRSDLEAVLAAIHVVTTLDRSVDSRQTGPVRMDFEEGQLEELKGRARRLGATDDLLGLTATKRRASINVPKTRE